AGRSVYGSTQLLQAAHAAVALEPDGLRADAASPACRPVVPAAAGRPAAASARRPRPARCGRRRLHRARAGVARPARPAVNELRRHPGADGRRRPRRCSAPLATTRRAGSPAAMSSRPAYLGGAGGRAQLPHRRRHARPARRAGPHGGALRQRQPGRCATTSCPPDAFGRARCGGGLPARRSCPPGGGLTSATVRCGGVVAPAACPAAGRAWERDSMRIAAVAGAIAMLAVAATAQASGLGFMAKGPMARFNERRHEAAQRCASSRRAARRRPWARRSSGPTTSLAHRVR
ncbi:MAG: hypothetical protein MZW92_44785, partial [Comamonadaceae bacterium]|nr:hypothetical protein [Comamonadaceae bacterium]